MGACFDLGTSPTKGVGLVIISKKCTLYSNTTPERENYLPERNSYLGLGNLLTTRRTEHKWCGVGKFLSYLYSWDPPMTSQSSVSTDVLAPQGTRGSEARPHLTHCFKTGAVSSGPRSFSPRSKRRKQSWCIFFHEPWIHPNMPMRSVPTDQWDFNKTILQLGVRANISPCWIKPGLS